MLIDAAKGIEDRTRKLFEVCKMRQLPGKITLFLTVPTYLPTYLIFRYLATVFLL